MDLAEDIVATYFARTDLVVGLALGDTELAAAGYQREPARQWSVDGATARTEVLFGPFRALVRFDTVVLYRDGEELDRVRLAGMMQLIPGTVHSQEYSAGVATVG